MANPNPTSIETPALQPDRAFVVELTSSPDVARAEVLSGRVEHVVSGRAARFASAVELLEFMHGVLRSPPSARKRQSAGTSE